MSTVRFVVDAFVAVIAVVEAYGNCEACVEEEKKDPPFSQSEEVVALVEVPKVELGFTKKVNGYAKVLVEHVGHVTAFVDSV